MAKSETAKPVKAAAGTRKLSAYNKYMKTELAKHKEANPDMDHKTRFKAVAAAWKNSPENPKRVTK